MKISRKYYVLLGVMASFALCGAAGISTLAAEESGYELEGMLQTGNEKEETIYPENSGHDADLPAEADVEPDETPEEEKDGWHTNAEGKVCYYLDGKLQMGWQEIEGKRYYFSPESGEMQTGLQEIEGKRYYFSPESGKMQTGKKKIGKATYYFKSSGAQQTGWLKLKGKKYYFSPKNGKMQTGKKQIGKNAYYFNKNGVMLTCGWLRTGGKTYFCNKNGKLHSGWLERDGGKYYFSPANYEMQTGWVQIGSYKYYLASSGDGKGVLQTNGIVGSGPEGFFYADAEGRQITAIEVKHAVAFVKTHTKDWWPSDVKLQQCFEVLWRNYSYQRFYETPTAASMPGYAEYMFANGRGNCYRYAASFAYIAKVLGYDSRVAVGSISSSRGGMTPHGWTEVNVGGAWYMCDANMQKNHPGINSYMRTEANYAYRHTCSARYALAIQNGGVTWQ